MWGMVIVVLLRHVWKAKALHPRLKMRLYVSAVCSIMIYGSEA